jgi:hypothetical protein
MFDLDAILKSGSPTINMRGHIYLGLVEFESAVTMTSGILDMQSLMFGASHVLWGNNGSLDVGDGHLHYPQTFTLFGTVSVTNGSPTATFTKPQSLANGSAITFASQAATYTISGTTTQSTTATLSVNYTGTTAGATTASTTWAAAQALPLANGLKIDASTVGCIGIPNVSSPTLACNRSLTAANADSDYGPTLGAYWIEGGGSIGNQGL